MIRKSCEIHGFRFSLATDCAHMAPHLHGLFPPLCGEPAGRSPEWRLLRAGPEEGIAAYYGGYEDGSALFEAVPASEALDRLEWAVTRKILEAQGHLLQLHAAAVVVRGKALLFVGPSGVGKTSLALSLLLRGWRCLSDEIVFVDPATCDLLSFPRSFHVDERTMRHFRGLDAACVAGAFKDASGKARVDPARLRDDWSCVTAKPHRVIFPVRGGHCAAAIDALGETEAFARLAAQAINLADLGMAGVETLMRLVRSCGSYVLRSGDLEAASALVEETAGEGDPGRESIAPGDACTAELHVAA